MSINYPPLPINHMIDILNTLNKNIYIFFLPL